jgi:DNA repair exonuclease SbcCD ATPase subunit
MKNITFKKVTFANFMSFGNLMTEVNLETPGTNFILGENLDEGGSSGAGKTTVISAISYALYDKIPSGVSKDKLINRTNEKKNTVMEVNLYFDCGDDEYQVTRTRGARNSVQLWENGTDITPDSIVNFNDKVETIFGMSFQLFSLVVMFNGNARPFLDLGVGEQRNLIEELLRITTLSRKANAMKKEIGLTERAIDMQKTLISQQELQNKTYWRHVEEAKERVKRWTTTRDAQLMEIQAKLDRVAGIDLDAEEALHVELKKLTTKLSPLKQEVRTQKADNEARKKELQKLSDELGHLIEAKCPYCLQKFEDAEAKIAELREKIKIKVGERNTVFESLTTDEIEVDRINDEIEAIEAKIQHSDLAALLQIKSNADSLNAKMLELANQDNPHVEALNALVNEGEIKIDRDTLDELVKLLNHQQVLVKLLTDKNSFIRKDIISKNIPFLNKRIGYYTQKLNLPHIVNFMPDMSCEISQYNRSLDHGNLSNGEKKRLNLALCLAFRDTRTYLHSKVNVLFTDEVDGGSLDTNSIEALIHLLKTKAWDDHICIYIISHRPEFEGRCDKTVAVRKDGGFSQLMQVDHI